MKIKNLLPFIACITLFGSCVKDAATTGNGNVSLQLKGLVSSVQGAQIIWTVGSASVSAVRLEAQKSDTSHIEYFSSANFQADLFAPVTVATVSIPSGSYRHIEFRTELVTLNSHPSLHLEGTYTAGGVGTPIVFEIGTAVTISASRDTITIVGSNSYTGLTTLNFSVLTQGITEADLKAADRTSGKIVLSASSNPAIYAKMLTNLATCSSITFQ